MSSTPPPPKDPPRYRSSMELTRVIPRADLAPKPEPPAEPASTVPGPTIEQLADVARLERDSEEAEREMQALREAGENSDTMVPCPCCAQCPLCHGLHLVPPDVAKKETENT